MVRWLVPTSTPSPIRRHEWIPYRATRPAATTQTTNATCAVEDAVSVFIASAQPGLEFSPPPVGIDGTSTPLPGPLGTPAPDVTGSVLTLGRAIIPTLALFLGSAVAYKWVARRAAAKPASSPGVPRELLHLS